MDGRESYLQCISAESTRRSCFTTSTDMRQLSILFISFLALTWAGCNRAAERPAAISDFRKELQPVLTRAVAKGLITYDDSLIHTMPTNAELNRLRRSEHPLLRAYAAMEMCERREFNPIDIIMQQLNDSAVIVVDEGEFGVDQYTVADYLLRENRNWKKLPGHEKLLDEVILHHNRIQAAFQLLEGLAPQEKYYAAVKAMAGEPVIIDDNNYHLRFYDIEFALYMLASYKKPVDIPFLREILSEKIGFLSFRSLNLMRDFPDTAWFPVLSYYYRYYLPRLTGVHRGGFSGGYADPANAEEFYDALVMQRHPQAAALLDTLLTQVTVNKSPHNRGGNYEHLVRAIWKQDCPAYQHLREKIKHVISRIGTDKAIMLPN